MDQTSNTTTSPCIAGESEIQSKEDSVLARMESLILELFVSRKNTKPKTYSNCDPLPAVQPSDWGPCDHVKCSQESATIPEEFQVREFPASSLFSLSKSANQNTARLNQRGCRHQMAGVEGSRDERFYHVFKRGELEEMVKSHIPSLTVTDTTYRSGHWCITLSKTSQHKTDQNKPRPQS